MSEIKTTTGNYRVIANDSLFSFEKEDVIVEFKDLAGVLLKINFKFVFDSSKEQKIESRPTDTTPPYLNVTIFNAVGEGTTTTPIQIRKNDTNHKSTYLSLGFNVYPESFFLKYTIFEQQ